MLLTNREQLAERRRDIAASSDLLALRLRVRHLLEPFLVRPLYLPGAKALLSQDGGVCAVDGARLDFDPFAPDEHRCPRCGATYRGERHHRAWVWRYHLWLSERAIHLALLGLLSEDRALVRRAIAVLDGYGAIYFDCPNQDNVLGPTRLFFSTYLESLWLSQILLAASLVEEAGEGWDRAALQRVAEASVRLIASFDEAGSNRQVWNNLAMLCAGRWLGDPALVQRAVDGGHGLRRQLEYGVTADGLWYEGENYHFFALHAFLLAAEVLRAGGTDLYLDRSAGPRLARMYVAPLESLLPDLTLPARGDSPYGVSVRQPRFAELWEIGRVRTRDARLDRVLTDLYCGDLPEGEDVGLSEIAEQERNRPASRLSRGGLGWKALLWMDPEPPHVEPSQSPASSRLLPDAGLAVLRPRADAYVSLECGGRPGGHGHPDLLHVSLFDGGQLLADFGTGSYVSPALQWYRSTAAHNAPAPLGMDQLARDGWCESFDVRGAWAWCAGAARDLFGPRTAAIRVLVASPDWVLDVVDIDVPPATVVELPVHPLSGVTYPEGELAEPIRRLSLGHDAAAPAAVLFLPRAGEVMRVQQGLGPPGPQLEPGAPLPYLVRQAAGPGHWVQLYAFRGVDVLDLTDSGHELCVHLRDGVDRVRVGEGEVWIADRRGARHHLDGHRAAPPRSAAEPLPARARIPCPRLEQIPDAAVWTSVVPDEFVQRLGWAQYRRAEEPHAGSFEARVAFAAAGSTLCFLAAVTKPRLWFRSPAEPDPALDNEMPDIHSDGLQCYVDLDGWHGVVAVPDATSSRVHLRAVGARAVGEGTVCGRWARTADGYSVVLTFEVGRELARGDRLPVALVVNEMYPDRMRRAGQLVLGGEPGWVYLRGDRESPRDALLAEVV